MTTQFNPQEVYDKKIETLTTLVEAYNKLNGEIQEKNRQLQEIALEITRVEAVAKELMPFVKTQDAPSSNEDNKPAESTEDKAFEGAVAV